MPQPPALQDRNVRHGEELCDLMEHTIELHVSTDSPTFNPTCPITTKEYVES
jgi:hypothetical protein